MLQAHCGRNPHCSLIKQWSGRKQECTFTRIPCSAWEKCTILKMQPKSGKTNVNFGDVPYFQRTARTSCKLTKKTQCERVDISPRIRKIFFQSQMDESNFLKGIKTWKHPPWYGIDHFEEKVTLIFYENLKGLHLHHLTTHFRMPVKRKMTFGPCQEASYTAITLNQESNFTRREKNHSLFHWSTLTFPELLIRISMSSKRKASMIIGISMGQIFGQVSHNLLHWKKNLQTEKCVSRESFTRKQLTSRPDYLWPELWEKMGKNAMLKEREKWSHEKPRLDNAWKLRGIYFIYHEDKEFKETIKNARKKLENSDGSCYALQDQQEQSELWKWW